MRSPNCHKTFRQRQTADYRNEIWRRHFGSLCGFQTKSAIHQVFRMKDIRYAGNFVCAAPYVLINFDTSEFYFGRFEPEYQDFKYTVFKSMRWTLQLLDAICSLGDTWLQTRLTCLQQSKQKKKNGCNVVIKVNSRSLRLSDQNFDHAITESTPLCSKQTTNLNDLSVAHSIVVACSKDTILVMRKKDLTIKPQKSSKKQN